MTDRTLDLFLRISRHRMIDNYLPKIRRCLNALETKQMWEHESHEANSIGGILLHICEHLSRHTGRYNRVETISSGGIEDYFPDIKISHEELVARIEETFNAWQRAFDKLHTDASRTVDIHGIYHLAEHVSYHLGQIVDRVQRNTGESFQFVQNGLNERGLLKIIEGETHAKF